MQILAALFVEKIDQRQAEGGAARLDLTGAMFSFKAASPPPVSIQPHLVVIVRCAPDEPGVDSLEVRFLDESGTEVARNAQPLQVEPGKFSMRLVRAELTFPGPGTISAHCRTAKSDPVVVPLTLLA